MFDLTAGTYLIIAVSLAILAVIVFRGPVRRDYLQRGRLTVLSSTLETLVFCFLGILIWISMSARWPRSDMAQPLVVVAWAIMIIGFLGTVASMARLGMPRSLGHGKEELLRSGLYRISRNPQVVFCGGLMIGYAWLSWTWYALGIVILYILMTHLMIVTEEEHLLKKYGDQYRDYCNRVSRYLGPSWKKQGSGESASRV